MKQTKNVYLNTQRRALIRTSVLAIKYLVYNLKSGNKELNETIMLTLHDNMSLKVISYQHHRNSKSITKAWLLMSKIEGRLSFLQLNTPSGDEWIELACLRFQLKANRLNLYA